MPDKSTSTFYFIALTNDIHASTSEFYYISRERFNSQQILRDELCTQICIENIRGFGRYCAFCL